MSSTHTHTFTEKTRGTHARVQRVKVTPVPRPKPTTTNIITSLPVTTAAGAANESSNSSRQVLSRNCTRCKESANCVKTLSDKLGKIDDLVNELKRTAHHHGYSIEAAKELQRLVSVTSNTPRPATTSPSRIAISDITNPPAEIEKIEKIEKPNRPMTLARQKSLRKDSGYTSDPENKHPNSINNLNHHNPTRRAHVSHFVNQE
ncbi:4248_t:CDS:2 [Ambispora leptoticha]|uniref:4248_t:CDS:1 n=1 Tax=Ambispora leptoticha TaxID=144679 RepID=A0A9N9DCQ5_9GLOM|nr:4248_t:CDS:2 [Ambispora leptoticha]